MSRPRRGRGGLAPWLGQAFLAVGRALYLGPAGDTTPHAHHALQLSVGLEGPVRLRHAAGPWQELDGALVPPDVAHQLDGRGGPVLLLYLEPESEDGRSWLLDSPSEIQPVDHDAVAAVRAAAQGLGCEFDAGAAYARMLESVGIANAEPTPSDPRVGAAIRRLRRDPAMPRALGPLAQEVGLSPSRFRHLFREQIGMSTQSYVVWLRLYTACRALAGGAPLSDAALCGGFSDAAHFTRTFRRTFGLAPSQVAARLELMNIPRPV